jgi:FG-GAP repeat protein
MFIDRCDMSGGSSPRDVASAEFNGDGDDFAVAFFGNTTVVASPGIETLTDIDFGEGRYTAASAENPRSLGIGDVDDDGRPDILIANQGNGFVRLRVNRHTFSLRP